MSIISGVTPNSRGDWIASGGAGAGGALFMVKKGGPSAHRAQFVKQIDKNQAAEKAAWLDYHDARIKPHWVLPKSIDIAAGKEALVKMANEGHSPSLLRIGAYGAIGALGAGLATAGVVNLVQSY